MNSKKIVVVTGATNGIGKETALGLAKAGLSVYIVGRDAEKTRTVVDEIRATSQNSNVDFFVADLSSQKEIRRLSTEIHQKLSRIDLLINNAGGFFARRETTVDGLEMTFAFNHLGYFLLTNLLLDLVKKAGSGSRIVNVSSMAHGSGKIDFDNLQGERRFSGWAAYANSKLANVLFTMGLARKLAGTGITANCLHPGFVATGFGGKSNSLSGFVVKLVQVFAISPERGALTSLYLALSPEVEGKTGGYYEKSQLSRPQKLAFDEGLQDRLWEVSAQLTS